MREAAWLGCSDPAEMLEVLRRRGSQRKLRLFACACARRVHSGLPEVEDAVDTAERAADGLIGVDELSRITGALPTWYTPRMPALRSALSAAKKTASSAADLRGWKTPSGQPPWTPAHRANRDAEKKAQCALLRDLFGSPFRAVNLNPALLPLGVVALAQAAYDERVLPSGELDTSRLAGLADALQGAGCTEQAILDHLRGPGPHVRGCWPVDLVLARE